MTKRLTPSVNAGSMADIAFLLLIFFLVTTTIETDYGIRRQLSPPQDDPIDTYIKEKNVLEIAINQNDELAVEGNILSVEELKNTTIAFLDNGGNASCDYCRGKNDKKSSDHPDKAVISLVSDRESSYEMYVAVQNELMEAYNELRNRESERLYGVSYEVIKQNLNSNSPSEKHLARERMLKIQSLYPEKISETSLTR